MRRTVAVGVDGSPASLAAADWAAREAVRRQAPLRLVNAAAPPPGLTSTDPRRPPDDDAWSPHALAEDLRRAHPGARIDVDQVVGQPLPVLFAAADEAELLVLGSRGAGAAAGFLLGSVPLTVVGQAPVPVVLVRAGGPAGAGAPSGSGAGTEVVLGLDLDRPSDSVVGFAFDAAARRLATLRVVHGWNAPLPYGLGPASADPEAREELQAHETGALAEALAPWREKYPHTHVVGETIVGDADRHLLGASAEAALLVIGRRPRGTRISAHLGSTSHSVLHHAVVPVAVVPHD
ncbi:Nucleotide-binding universal stress protein, UspA family [Actinacidiphila yanglinensis]|uniref:Nucleotide-binding universal stress protein, UspA family n=1 Tax=Actinacidiphila yanglinensis TaxID=310779 RepID=A0A1H6D605_9ACTN|nr:universal stress protein [Actinacidiphila yanglinensis]SEG80504.1 Nucleotide-binding universal stress protein, UspA family [Actinacidiphila yanglinensis]